MKLTWPTFAIAFVAVSAVNAHFQVQYPPVRGPFDDDNEPQFCGLSFPGCSSLARKKKPDATSVLDIQMVTHNPRTDPLSLSTTAIFPG